ncbi:hypothetical protein [Escherichia coli]|uniref:hypothetical protein n=1 Tax=Escherichia coli TaxID=562 RepID=UPI0013B369F6|nr:hypothetical protein [Escherichia coli]ELQ3590294.1 hypothetical protein [Escherichia coli]MBE8045595.1 hypothetical protein [Escherichia coli]
MSTALTGNFSAGVCGDNQKRYTPGFLIFHEMGAISREAACPVRWWKKPDKTTALCKYRSNMVLLCEI